MYFKDLSKDSMLFKDSSKDCLKIKKVIVVKVSRKNDYRFK